jgi:hypothetical protein
MRSISCHKGQPHETGKNPFMVDAPTFRQCMPCSGLCQFVPAESQFQTKKLQSAKILCNACVDSWSGKHHWL